MEVSGFTVPGNVKNGTMLSQSAGDQAILATFSDDYVLNEHRTKAEGRAIHDQFIKITLQYPGDNLSTYEERFLPTEAVDSKWVERFPKQWAAFQRQHEQVASGTPVSEWPLLDKGRVLMYKSLGFQTVEQIAAVSDKLGPSLGLDWQTIRRNAQAFLSPDNAAQQVSALTLQNDDMKNQIAAMQQQMAEMRRLQTEANPAREDDVQPKRRGRKPNSVMETEDGI